jgi:TolA-binding protein
MLTKEREAELRKIHTDNRYGVLELLDKIASLKAKLERTKEHHQKQRQENNEIEQAVFDEQYDIIQSLKDQLQWSIKNEEQYKNALAEQKENLMQFQSEAQRMFDVEKAKMMNVIAAAYELRHCKWGRTYKKACEHFDKVWAEWEKKC